jgi:hypothetical protein
LSENGAADPSEPRASIGGGIARALVGGQGEAPRAFSGSFEEWGVPIAASDRETLVLAVANLARATYACAVRPTHGLLALSLICLACGPGIGEMRMAYAPPRPPDCDLDFLQFDMRDLAPGARYELLGHITLRQEGTQDPLQPQYRDIVRPRACDMGGEAVGILGSAVAAPTPVTMGGTAVDYVVVRKRPPPGAPTKPQKF